MSAYIMGEKDLAIMARELVDYIGKNRKYGCRPFDNYTNELDTLPKDVDKVEYTYRKLYSLNMQSVNCRYNTNETHIPPMPKLMPKNGIIVKADETFTPLQLIRKIGCWQYQSCEDDKIFYGTFYREMGEWAGRLAIEEMPKEY